MLSHSTLSKLANLIRAIADTESQAEDARQILCQKTHFEPNTAFKRISNFSSVITSQQLLRFLQQNDVEVGRHDVYYLIRVFDSNGDGKLSYLEFLNVVLPKTNPALRKEVNARRSYTLQGDEGLPSHIESAIAKVFSEELEAYRRCETVRQELVNSEDFTVMNAFRDIDLRDHGYIDAEKIVKFMELIEEPLEEAQVQAFMTRADKHASGFIRYADFLELFHSAENGYAEDKPEPEPVRESGVLGVSGSPVKASHAHFYEQPRDFNASPAKKIMSASKLAATGESFYSPQSTKASFAHSGVFKTPTKRSASRVDYEESLEVSHMSAPHQRKPSSHFTVNFSPRRESPMKPKDELELVKALKEMVEHIHALEGAKNGLAVKEDFTTYNAFAVFDLEKKGCVNTKQLEQGFQALNIHCAKSDIALLMKRLDTDLDGLVRFEDFSNVITPKTAEFAKLTFMRKPRYVSGLQNTLEAFSEETMEAYKSFLIGLIEGETICESIRQRLVKRKSFNLHDAFKALDRYDNGFITAEHFKELFVENGLSFSQKDFNSLVERYAKSAKGKISYYEFVKEMTPKSVEKY